MKKTLKLILAIVLTNVSIGISQNGITILSLKVGCKSVSQTTANAGIMDIKCISQATINLNSNSGASKIHFKMVNLQTNGIVYQVSYLLNSSPVYSAEGIKLFENNDGTIFISNGQAITLRPHTYQIQTENSQGVLSSVFTETH